MTGLERQVLQSRLWMAVLDIDLQLHKGGVHELRWGSPGVGLDVAIPCYQEARRTAELTPWPEELREGADELAERIAKYVVTLEARDVTSASGQHSGLTRSFEALRERVRVWADGGAPGLDGAAGSRR